jgi:hypothetical protein
VLITPSAPVRVSKQLRAALPKNATVRLVSPTSLAASGEQVVVYERGSQYEPHSHVAVIKNNERVADYSLTQLFRRYGIVDTYELFQASEIRTSDDRGAFVTAFRNIGDGSGTLFVVLTERQGGYEIWKQATTQGRLRVLRNGEMELWSAGDVPDGKIDCVWCSRYYKVESFQWKVGIPAKLRQFITKRTLDPNAVADKPIVIEK